MVHYNEAYNSSMSLGGSRNDIWEANIGSLGFLESLIDRWGHILNSFREEVMAERAEIEGGDVRGQGGLFPHCVGFIDCTNFKCADPERKLYTKGRVIRSVSDSTA